MLPEPKTYEDDTFRMSLVQRTDVLIKHPSHNHRVECSDRDRFRRAVIANKLDVVRLVK